MVPKKFASLDGERDIALRTADENEADQNVRNGNLPEACVTYGQSKPRDEDQAKGQSNQVRESQQIME